MRIYLEKEPLDILSINESRLDETISTDVVSIPGYELIFKNRNRMGGGVAIYYRSILNIKNRQDLIPANVEAVCLEVTRPKSKPILITSVYRPPNSQMELFNEIESLFQNLDNEHKEQIIVGDFNCDLLQDNLKNHTKRLNDIVNLFQLEQIINLPTRITDSTSSLLDIALVTNPENILQHGVLHVGISDHSLIYVCRKLSPNLIKNQVKVIRSRDYKNYMQGNFNFDLSNALLNMDWENDDPNGLWENFKTTFNYVSDVHVPIKSRRVRNKIAPWLTNEIKKNINKRDFLKKKAISSCISSLQIDDQSVIENSSISNLFNEYFTDIGPTLSSQIPETNVNFEMYMKFSAKEQFNFRDIHIQEVLREISNLNTSKSAGSDNIPAKLIKDAKDVVAPFLTIIFNASLKSGIFPDDFKIAKVSPIYKSGNKKERGNYRPISVLSIIAKIFEKLVYSQLNKFLTENSILSPCQSGFRKGHSTTTALLENTDSWLLNMDSGLLNGVLFLDLCKAFETVNHEILIKKLFTYGIQNKSLDWFKSYLQNRKQFCVVNNATSSLRNLNCGVPQGSNLGPLLFLLYVNDLPNCLKKSHDAMYADDTNITVRSSSLTYLEEALNDELENIHQWLLSNKLTLNVKKTEYMVIGTRQRLRNFSQDINVSIDGKVLKEVKTKKTLGVLVDKHLSWDKHIDNVSKKVSKGIGMLRRAKQYVSTKTLEKLYHALVQPHFDYCSNYRNSKTELQE